MHELSIAEAVVQGVCERLGDAKINRVVVEIGRLSGVVADALQFCFEMSTKGTPVEGATLEIIDIPGLGQCRQCNANVEMDSFIGVCGVCGGIDLELVNGQELRIKCVEVA